MKKRIISLVLALVMVVATLVSCGEASLVSRDLNEYLEAEFNKEAFIEALSKLEIEDGTYTNDPAIRAIVETEEIYSAIASAVITEGNKIKEGLIGANDVLYFNYYITDAEDKIYSFASMKPASVTASATKANHSVQLGAVSENDDDYEFMNALKSALVAANADIADIKEYIYTVNSTGNTKITVGDEPVNVVVSYTRSYTAEDGGTVTEKVAYQMLTLDKSSSDALIQKLVSADTELRINKEAAFKKAGSETETENKVTIDKYTYSAFKVEWVIESGSQEMFSFNYTPDEKLELAVDSLSSSTAKVDLKGKELTYHVFPIYYYDVPETDAASIIRYALGKDIKVDSFDVFKDESYKNGDKTVKSIVEELAKIYTVAASKTEKFDKTSTDADIKLLGLIQAEEFVDESEIEAIEALFYLSKLKKVGDSSNEAKEEVNKALVWINNNIADNETAKELKTLKKVYDDLMADSNATDAKKTEAESKYKAKALELYDEQKTEFYNEALDTAKANKIKLIVEAESTTAEIKNLGEAVLAEKKADVKYSLEVSYNTHISEAVGKAVYKLIDEYVKIDDDKYPEDLIKEFYDHIYESYEYKFYKENSATKDKYGKTQSNYKAHGNLETFLKSSDGTGKEDWKSAINAEAKSHVAPLIKLYVVAKAFATEANRDTTAFIQADIDAGRYDADYENDDSLSDAENQKKKDEAEEDAKKNKENALKNAAQMLVTDEVFNEYKKELGSAYSYYEEQYGEQNLRAALQSNRLFYYFVSNVLVEDTNDNATSNVKTLAEQDADGKWVVKFHNSMIGYVLVEGTSDSTDTDTDQ